MFIRKANKTDKTQIQDLMDELNLYRKSIFNSDNQSFHERIKSHSKLQDKDLDETLIFVAVNNSENIVGFVQGGIHQRNNHKLNKLGYVDELYMKEEVRGRGVAKKLFSKLESKFKEQECDHMTTHTDFENQLSQGFYLQAGMSKVTVELWKEL